LLLETLFLYYFFSKILPSPVVKKLLVWVASAFISIWLFYFLLTSKSQYLNVCNSIENVSILTLAIIYYYEQIVKKNSLLISEKPAFWIVSAYFINCAGTFFLYLYMATLSPDEQEKYYTVINSVFTIVRTILLCVGLTIYFKNSSAVILKGKMKFSDD